MALLRLGCVLLLCLSLGVVYGEIRLARSAQFSHASAQANAGSFGRPNIGPRPPVIAPRPPGFGPRPPVVGPPPPAFGGGLSRPGGSISISKSISISRGGNGGASSNAGSVAYRK